MQEELAKKKRRGGVRAGAGRRSLEKKFVKAYLPRDLIAQLEAKAAQSARPKGKLVEEALRIFLLLPSQAPPPADPPPLQQEEVDLVIE